MKTIHRFAICCVIPDSIGALFFSKSFITIQTEMPMKDEAAVRQFVIRLVTQKKDRDTPWLKDITPPLSIGVK